MRRVDLIVEATTLRDMLTEGWPGPYLAKVIEGLPAGSQIVGACWDQGRRALRLCVELPGNGRAAEKPVNVRIGYEPARTAGD